jgi:hypothetical protein
VAFSMPMRQDSSSGFRLTPERTMKCKGEKCVGGKLSKDCIIVLVCANADRTEKRNLFMTGKPKTRTCLKKFKKHASSIWCKQKSLRLPTCFKLSCNIGIENSDWEKDSTVRR